MKKQLTAIRDELDSLLDQRHTAATCLMISLVSLGVAMLLWTMQAIALVDTDAGKLYRRPVLWLAEGLTTASVVGYLAIATYCWSRFRSQQPRTWLSYVMTTLILVSATYTAIFYGLEDTPLTLILIAGVALTRASFPARVLLPGLVISTILIIGSEALIRQHVLPYAPLLTAPVYTGNVVAPWWVFWMQLIYILVIAIFSSLMFFLFGMMDRRNHELEILTRVDPLTGLLNHATFMKMLEEECAKQVRHQRPFCVMMCDLDHFKKVNDTWGHAAGDQVLVQIGKVLTTVSRHPIDVVARYGGEEFVVLLPEADLTAARRVAERIGNDVRKQIVESDGNQFSVTISIGIAQATGGKGESALQVADKNLYSAKSSGRDCIVGSMAT